MPKFVINTIKSFIRDYGQTVTWVTTGTITRDLLTGDPDKNETKTVIKRALIMPEHVGRKFSYDLSYIAANKNFVLGGFFDKGEVAVIFLTSQLPIIFDLNDFVEFDNSRYSIKDTMINPEGAVATNLVRVRGMDNVD